MAEPPGSHFFRLSVHPQNADTTPLWTPLITLDNEVVNKKIRTTEKLNYEKSYRYSPGTHTATDVNRSNARRDHVGNQATEAVDHAAMLCCDSAHNCPGDAA